MKYFSKQFFNFTIAFATLIFMSITLSSYLVKSRGFLNHQTGSNLLFLEKNQTYDLLFMGTSHARNFSNYNNHQQTEKILQKKMVNLGIGGGLCGVNEQLFYLDYFYKQGNQASQLIYVLGPPLIYSETLPIASNTFDYEPFETSFLIDYLFFDTENKSQRILSYLRSKLSLDWFQYSPIVSKCKPIPLTKIDSIALKKGLNNTFPNGKFPVDRFEKSTDRVKETINLGIKNKAEIILMIPPALFGKWRGHEEVMQFGKRMAKRKGIRFYDLSESVLIPKYYYDHHHLNCEGVAYFNEKYLKKIINND